MLKISGVIGLMAASSILLIHPLLHRLQVFLGFRVRA
jgi:hypothetical protein